tara:strand:+ start:195659 stop:196264 length:606 start_codon:yes stop_codon:yes gene_type:complete
MILLKLGFWQVERLAWKSSLLTSIESEYAKDAERFPITAKNITQIYQSLPANTLYRGVISGRLQTLDTIEFMPSSPHDGVPAFIVRAVVMLDGALPARINLGWIYYEQRDVVIASLRRFDGQDFDFTAALRKGNHDNDRAEALYLFDADEHLLLSNIVNGRSAKPELRNKHKSYAIFWFTMAGVLMAFYLIFMIKQKTLRS